MIAKHAYFCEQKNHIREAMCLAIAAVADNWCNRDKKIVGPLKQYSKVIQNLDELYMTIHNIEEAYLKMLTSMKKEVGNHCSSQVTIEMTNKVCSKYVKRANTLSEFMRSCYSENIQDRTQSIFHYPHRALKLCPFRHDKTFIQVQK